MVAQITKALSSRLKLSCEGTGILSGMCYGRVVFCPWYWDKIYKLARHHFSFRWRMWYCRFEGTDSLSCRRIIRVNNVSRYIVHSLIEFLCCRRPLSFHAVSFGPSNQSLRRMAQIAREVESSAPRDASLPANAHIESSYAEALDSVR